MVHENKELCRLSTYCKINTHIYIAFFPHVEISNIILVTPPHSCIHPTPPLVCTVSIHKHFILLNISYTIFSGGGQYLVTPLFHPPCHPFSTPVAPFAISPSAKKTKPILLDPLVGPKYLVTPPLHPSCICCHFSLC